MSVTTAPLSQKARLLDLLREHPEGICVGTVPWELSYTARNRISELRKDGFNIVGAPCKAPHGHKANVMAYRLVRNAQQTVMPL